MRFTIKSNKMYKIKIKRGCTTEFGGKMCWTVVEKSQKNLYGSKKGFILVK